MRKEILKSKMMMIALASILFVSCGGGGGGGGGAAAGGGGVRGDGLGARRALLVLVDLHVNPGAAHANPAVADAGGARAALRAGAAVPFRRPCRRTRPSPDPPSVYFTEPVKKTAKARPVFLLDRFHFFSPIQ